MLKLDSVSIAYGAIQAVKGVSIEVRAGEVVTIIGANGAGKSTLLKGIAGLEPLTGGVVLIDGKDCTGVPAHRRVGLGVALSPEGRGVFPDQTVRDNLLLGALARPGGRGASAPQIDRALTHFPALRERLDRPAGGLSGGQQQMLAVARGLMAEPHFLLLDEPSLGLAPLMVREIFAVIARLRDEGVTVLLVEQMAAQALALADRAYVLERGRVTLSGPATAIRSNPEVVRAYLGSVRAR